MPNCPERPNRSAGSKFPPAPTKHGQPVLRRIPEDRSAFLLPSRTGMRPPAAAVWAKRVATEGQAGGRLPNGRREGVPDPIPRWREVPSPGSPAPANPFSKPRGWHGKHLPHQSPAEESRETSDPPTAPGAHPRLPTFYEGPAGSAGWQQVHVDRHPARIRPIRFKPCRNEKNPGRWHGFAGAGMKCPPFLIVATGTMRCRADLHACQSDPRRNRMIASRCFQRVYLRKPDSRGDTGEF